MKPDLSPRIFRYRVVNGDEIVGQFSNLPLASDTARDCRGIVLDISAEPHRVVYKDGRLLEHGA